MRKPDFLHVDTNHRNEKANSKYWGAHGQNGCDHSVHRKENWLHLKREIMK